MTLTSPRMTATTHTSPAAIEPHVQPVVSIIVPVYNEAESVEPLLQELFATGQSLGIAYELVIVDDGSKDDTVARLKAAVPQLGGVLRVVELSRNYGQTAAMAAGFAQARGQVFATLDGDLQNNPADIPMMITTMMDQDADLVVGWRQNRQDAVISRKLPSWLANRLISWMTGIQFKDYGCSLKVYRREVAQDMPLYGELHRFIPVLASMDGARIVQVPVSHRARQFGQSKYGISRTFKVILDLGMLLFMQRFMTRPMHMFGRVGLLSAGMGFVILVALTVQKFMTHHDIGARPMLMLGLLLVLAGIQLFSTGLIAELQIRTYFESQGKAPYKIRAVHSA